MASASSGRRCLLGGSWSAPAGPSTTHPAPVPSRCAPRVAPRGRPGYMLVGPFRFPEGTCRYVDGTLSGCKHVCVSSVASGLCGGSPPLRGVLLCRRSTVLQLQLSGCNTVLHRGATTVLRWVRGCPILWDGQLCEGQRCYPSAMAQNYGVRSVDPPLCSCVCPNGPMPVIWVLTFVFGTRCMHADGVSSLVMRV